MSIKRAKIAINGTGRIGLNVARILSQKDNLELVAINSTAPIDTLVHLLKHDSVSGTYDAKRVDSQHICINDSKNIRILNDRDPVNVDFGEATCVLECTGAFNSLEKSSVHLKNNVKNVIISAPASDTPTFVYGVNHTSYKGQSVISNASCTTNALAPIVHILDSIFGIENGFMTTIHSYTNDQNLLDVKHKDLRRARAATLNLIPTSTGVSKAIGLVLPHLLGKLEGYAVRVPTPNVSLIDLSVNLKSPATKDSLLQAFVDANKILSAKNLIEIDNEMRVSSDFIGSKYSCTIIPDKCLALENSVKVLAWYDNEIGYTHRLVDMCEWICMNG